MSELVSRGYVREVVRQRGLHLSRTRGQNFLVDSNHLEKIATAAALRPGDRVLEIGAGFGTLTELLAREAGWVVAIELDHGVFDVLHEHVGSRSNVRLVEGDALELDLVTLLDELPQAESTCIGWHAPKVVANLPYYITTAIIARLLEEVHPARPLERIVVMVQREVADRITAAPGTKDYSSFSVLVQYHAIPSIYSVVPAGAFFPTPKVDSALVVMRMRTAPAVTGVDEKSYFAIVRAAFAQRRKTLANALAAAPGLPEKSEIIEALESVNIDPRRRGETLSLEEFARLASALQEQGGAELE